MTDAKYDTATSTPETIALDESAQVRRANSDAQAFVEEVMEQEMAAGRDNFVYLNLLSILGARNRVAA